MQYITHKSTALSASILGNINESSKGRSFYMQRLALKLLESFKIVETFVICLDLPPKNVELLFQKSVLSWVLLCNTAMALR